LHTVIITSATTIPKCAFYYCSYIQSITIPDSVTSIGASAFEYCWGLKNVYITSISKWCEIELKDSPFSYGANLYMNGEMVTEVVIPDHITKIGDRTFYNLKSLTSITIPDSVTSIGNYAFYGCTGLETVYYEGSEEEWKQNFGNTFADLTILYNYKAE